MIVALIILSWCFLVACACCLGFSRTIQKRTEQRDKALQAAARCERSMQDMLYKTTALVYYVKTSEELKEFDQVLEYLTRCKGWEKSVNIAVLPPLKVAQVYHGTELRPEMFTKSLQFEYRELSTYYGYKAGIWTRNGWVFVPEVVFKNMYWG
jgi:hypothetical protein